MTCQMTSGDGGGLWRLLRNTGLFQHFGRLVSRAGLVGRPRAKPRLIYPYAYGGWAFGAPMKRK
jgi:hypothetical protein